MIPDQDALGCKQNAQIKNGFKNKKRATHKIQVSELFQGPAHSSRMNNMGSFVPWCWCL